MSKLTVGELKQRLYHLGNEVRAEQNPAKALEYMRLRAALQYIERTQLRPTETRAEALDALELIRSRLDPNDPACTASEAIRAKLREPLIRTYLEGWVVPLLDLIQFGPAPNRPDIELDAARARNVRLQTLQELRK